MSKIQFYAGVRRSNPMPTDRAPFETFQVYTPPGERQADGFIVIVQPNAKMFLHIHDEQSAKEIQAKQSQFIETAIREKLERCAHAD